MIKAIVIAVATVLSLSVGGLFAIGKFNLLVSLRRKIVADMLQWDLALRIECSEWSAQHGRDAADRPARVEQLCHEAVSGPLCRPNVEKLIAARQLLATRESVRTTPGAVEDNITALVHDYRRHLRLSPTCRLLAAALGFQPL